MNPTTFGQKSEVKSWEFDFSLVSTVFFSQIMFWNDVFSGPNRYGTEKKSFYGLKPDFAAPKPSKTAKNHENTTKHDWNNKGKMWGESGDQKRFY